MTRPATQFWCLVSTFGSNFQWQYVAAVSLQKRAHSETSIVKMQISEKWR